MKFALKNFRLLFSLLFILGVFTITSCSDDDENTPATPQQTIVDIAAADANFSILVSALTKASLVDVLNGTDEYTVFAPTNEAFNAAGITQATIDNWPDAEIDALTNTLLYHVVGGTVLSTDLSSGTVSTASGAAYKDIYINTSMGVRINGVSSVATPNVPASNGVIHIIDRALTLPSSIVEVVTGNDDFSYLLAALVTAYGEDEVANTISNLAPLTVFAPTNTAFQNAGFATIADIEATAPATLQSVLAYHLVGNRNFSTDLQAGAVTTVGTTDFFVSLNSTGVFINGKVGVTATDLLTNDGVVHIVNEVIMPPSQNVVEIAQGNDDFERLVQAILRVDGLAATLSGDGPFTVFAPTDAAFEAAGFDEAAIAAASPDALETILKYHVLGSRVFSTDLTEGNVSTLQGTEVEVSLSNGAQLVAPNTTADIVLTNLLGTNGVIHVIDEVIQPQ